MPKIWILFQPLPIDVSNDESYSPEEMERYTERFISSRLEQFDHIYAAACARFKRGEPIEGGKDSP
jgi:hypothetical protein